MRTDRHPKDSADALYFSARLHAKPEGMPTARTTIVRLTEGESFERYA